MVRDCRAFRAWGASSGENTPPAGLDAKAPATVSPRASRRPPLPVKPLGSGTTHKNQWKPEVISSMELHVLKSEMIGKERMIKDLEAENEKLRHQLVETLQIAEERESYLEKKNKEVQLLERSVEDLEVTIFTLENKVLDQENKNAMKEILFMPSTGKARTCSRCHEYGHQNLLSIEMPDMEIFLFECIEMEVYEKESEDASQEIIYMTLSEKARRSSADEMSTRDIHDDILGAQERAIHENEISVKELEMQLGLGLLDSMMEEGRWLDVTEHLDHVFRVYSTENEVAVPYDRGSSWQLRFAHPELYCLPRRQLALELASEGHLDKARVLANDVHVVVAWTKQKSNRWHACHLMDMMLFKEQVLLSSLTEEITRKEIDSERKLTCTAIRDYLHVYLPHLSGWLQMLHVASYDDYRQIMEKAASYDDYRQIMEKAASNDDYRQIMEKAGPNKFRCMLCHQLRVGPFSKSKLLRHLERCPAVTPCIEARFPQLRQIKLSQVKKYRRYREEEW